MAEGLGKSYLQEVLRGLRGQKRLAEAAAAQLSDSEMFLQIDSEANSVAVVMKHVCGNMRSRFTDFLTTDGEKPDRHRDQEFIAANLTREQLMQTWEAEWQRLLSTVESLQAEDVERTITIRGEPHSVLQALQRALMHYAQHVGQIVFLAKHIRGIEWKSLSIPRGMSESYKRASAGQFSKGLPK